MEIKRKDWPEELRSRSAVQAVAVGRCIRTGRAIGGGYSAHAHLGMGQICFRTPEAMADHQTVLHELAHLISGQGHTKKFRSVLADLGGDLKSWSERERTKARGEARHRWAHDRCVRCGWTRRGLWPSIIYTSPDGRHTMDRPNCGGGVKS